MTNFSITIKTVPSFPEEIYHRLPTLGSPLFSYCICMKHAASVCLFTSLLPYFFFTVHIEVASAAHFRKFVLSESIVSFSPKKIAKADATATVPTSMSAVQEEILKLVNEERNARGLDAYTWNTTLEKSAQDYAIAMDNQECFSHQCITTLKERMHASGYYQGGSKNYYYGENIALGQTTAKEVMKDWMNSPAHKAAILSEKYTEIGIGKSDHYWVQHFGAVR